MNFEAQNAVGENAEPMRSKMRQASRQVQTVLCCVALLIFNGCSTPATNTVKNSSQLVVPPALPFVNNSVGLPITNCVVITGTNRLGKPFTATNCPVAPITSMTMAWDGVSYYDPNFKAIMWPNLEGSTNLTGWYFVASPGAACRWTVPTSKPQEMFRLTL